MIEISPTSCLCFLVLRAIHVPTHIRMLSILHVVLFGVVQYIIYEWIFF